MGASILIGAGIISGLIIYIRRVAEQNPAADLFRNPQQSSELSVQDEWTKTATYHNEKYGYTVVYPSLYLSAQTTIPEKVYFIDSQSGSGRMFIEVKPTIYSTADQELDAKNSTFHSNDFLERRIRISGYDAIVTYPVSKADAFPDQVETFPNEKTVLFIKDRNLFRMSTSYIDHERIWNSFRFE